MIEDLYRLSPLQEGMLFESLYAPNAYVMQSSWNLGGDLDPDRLRRAWELIVERHAVLRSSFHWEGMERPHQIVHSEVALPWLEENWRSVPAGERDRRLQEREEADLRAGFDLESAPLFRLFLARLEDGLWSLTWTQHHLLVDGWSLSQVLSELFAIYRGLASRLPATRPFREYIEWLLRRDPREAEAFWRRELAGFETPTPLGSSEPARRHAFGGHGRVDVALETAALSDLGRRHRLTLNTLVQGAWALLLGYHAGEEDVVFGVVVSGRSVSELPGIESAVGPFLNTIPLRARMSAGKPLIPWLTELQERQLEARRFEHSPLVDVQGWSGVPRDRPLFESLLAFEGSLYDPALAEGTGGVRLLAGRSSHVSRAPITLVAMPEGETLRLVLLYDRDRFEEGEIARRGGQLRNLLLGMAADPDRALAELPVLTEAEEAQVRAWGRGDERTLPAETIHGLFLAQAQRMPDAVALVFEEERITYRELAERSGRLARELGVGPEDRVAVSLPRSIRLVETLLAILQAGAAYVPVDPEDPPERRNWIAADCGAALVIDESFAPEERHPSSLGFQPQALAYVIYTSGTTGRPKGSMLPHGAVVNHLRWAQSAYNLTPEDACLLKTPIGFDVSVRELFWPLSVGARVVIAKPGGERDLEYLAGLIEREGVKVVNLVPSLLAALDPPVKRIISGGETLSPELAERVLQRGISLHNHYGPTETAVNATAWQVQPGERPVPIGRPIAN
ncbi:MAG TPA: condensation domain-containing protein, partial [Thermoanaerobaculia bacterium]|nr:condensation domain-containing protein [Thermoanaerobaculia bacterium]